MGLDVTRLQVELGGQTLLAGVDFRAEAGRFVCLIGPNGAGKSTLMRALAQQVAYGGQVRLGGEPLHGLPRAELARRMAYLPQFTETPPLTVLETLELGRRARGARPEEGEALDALIARFGLQPYLRRPLERLSGGERQKVMIVATMAQEPSLLMLDEPIAHLDPKNQLEVLGAVAETTRSRGIVTLAVLHDVQLALHFADALLMLRGGAPHGYLARDAVEGEHLAALYDVPVKLFWQEGHPYVFFGHGHKDAPAVHHHDRRV
jgi:iron complex transport system ATP-binding protein